MLCQFSRRFPRFVSDILDRDLHLQRNFREESITDVLMAALVGLEPLGIRVDFPNEKQTGADMDWIFAAPFEPNGGRYLRFLLQAKRAHHVGAKDGGYWLYDKLDYGTPKGDQAATLVKYAKTAPDGMNTLPLYILYNPKSCVVPATKSRPAISGVNIMRADKVANVAATLERRDKAIDNWRDDFLTLSDFLCWPMIIKKLSRDPKDPSVIGFMTGTGSGMGLDLAGGFHPDLVADRINAKLQPQRSLAMTAGPDLEIELAQARDGIPTPVLEAIAGRTSEVDRRALKRPRVIMTTSLTRSDPGFERARRPVQ